MKADRLAMAFVALLLLCSATVAIDGSDGADVENVPISNMALYYTEAEFDSSYTLYNCKYYIPGSDNERLMLDWMESRDSDPRLIPDDRGGISDGQTVGMYLLADMTRHMTMMFSEDVRIRFSLLEGPQDATYLVRADVPFSIDVPSEYRGRMSMYIGGVESDIEFGETATLEKDTFVTVVYTHYDDAWVSMPITAKGAQRVTDDNMDALMQGYEKGRASSMYVIRAVSTFAENEYPGYNEFVFIEGSENELAMRQYIEDGTGDIAIHGQYNACVKDDWGMLEDGDEIVVYAFSTWYGDSIDIGTNVHDTEVVKEPYGVSFFLKVGDTLELDVVPSPMTSFSLLEDGMNIRVPEGHITIEGTTSNTISVSNNGGIYTDVYYKVSGNSEPSGSAMAYVVICIAVAAVAMGVMFLCNRPPKWAK